MHLLQVPQVSEQILESLCSTNGLSTLRAPAAVWWGAGGVYFSLILFPITPSGSVADGWVRTVSPLVLAVSL